MKKILILISLIITSINCLSQTIKVDSSNGLIYAETIPYTLSWIKGNPSISRVYIYTNGTNMNSSANFTYWIKYSIRIDSNTVNWKDINSGTLQIPINPQLSIEDASIYLFDYIANNNDYLIQYKQD